MRRTYLLLYIILLVVSCEKEGDIDFEPNKVSVKLKTEVDIKKTFQIINKYDFEVLKIRQAVFTSPYPTDSLESISRQLRQKDYIEDITGTTILARYNNVFDEVQVGLVLLEMKNKNFQKDWLQTMENLELKEFTKPTTSGFLMSLSVPSGEEIKWKKHFEKLEFVEWADLSWMMEFTR